MDVKRTLPRRIVSTGFTLFLTLNFKDINENGAFLLLFTMFKIDSFSVLDRPLNSDKFEILLLKSVLKLVMTPKI